VGIRLLVRVGETAPIHLGCPGKVLLAFLGDRKINDILNRIQLRKIPPFLTIVDRQKLLKQLSDIRARGWHYSQGEYVPGAWGLGAPILNAKGIAEAAIVISGVLQESKPPIGELTEQLLEATCNISKKLGYLNQVSSLKEEKNSFPRLKSKANTKNKTIRNRKNLIFKSKKRVLKNEGKV
jgi:DNA-binding IclR family transcriptional regulator